MLRWPQKFGISSNYNMMLQNVSKYQNGFMKSLSQNMSTNCHDFVGRIDDYIHNFILKFIDL